MLILIKRGTIGGNCCQDMQGCTEVTDPRISDTNVISVSGPTQKFRL